MSAPQALCQPFVKVPIVLCREAALALLQPMGVNVLGSAAAAEFTACQLLHLQN